LKEYTRNKYGDLFGTCIITKEKRKEGRRRRRELSNSDSLSKGFHVEVAMILKEANLARNSSTMEDRTSRP
jgi:hypothetical protein